MKVLLALVMMTFSLSLFAELVTCPLYDVAVIYQAEEGTTVKKGEVLYKLADWWHKNRIKKAKLEIKKCKAHLKDKKTDIIRAKKLYGKDAISLVVEENEVVNYFKCEYELIKANIELKQLELKLDYYIFKAPYDCKVIKHTICLNSGLDYGSPIMEIEPLNGSRSVTQSNPNMLLTTYV